MKNYADKPGVTVFEARARMALLAILQTMDFGELEKMTEHANYVLACRPAPSPMGDVIEFDPVRLATRA